MAGIKATGYWLIIVILAGIFPALHIPRFMLHAEAVTIVGTKHNLSTSGPGPIKATTETQVCVFCHTPHGAIIIPLWNHTLSTQTYTVPSNLMPAWASLKTSPQNPPDGDSRLCLSCHDGTVAIGSVVNLGGAATTISMQDTSGMGYLAGGMLSPSASSYIGTDLSGHHPVSIEFNTTLINDKAIQCNNYEVSFRLCNPQPPVKLRPTSNLYGGGLHTNVGVQCTSCHDPHSDPSPGTSKFLRIGTSDDTTPLCTKCHIECPSPCP